MGLQRYNKNTFIQIFLCFFLEYLPSLQHREEPPHHLFIFLLGYGFGHLLVELVHELGTVFDHFLHGEVLQELAVMVAVRAIFKIGAAVGIGPAVFNLRHRHPATLAELGELPFLEFFFLSGESGLVCREFLRFLISDEVSSGRAICRFSATQPSGDEFLRKEIGDFGILRLGVIVDVQFAGLVKACMPVEVDISLHA